MKFLNVYSRLGRRSLPLFAVILFSLSFLTAWYFSSEPSVTQHQRLLQRYLDRQQAEAQLLTQDTALIGKLARGSAALRDVDQLFQKDFGIFIYAQPVRQLLFWNTQKIHQPDRELAQPDGTYLQSMPNGQFVIQKQTVAAGGRRLSVVFVIPVLYHYYLVSNYLPTRFAHDRNAIKHIELATTVTNHPIHAANAAPVFYVNKTTAGGNEATDSMTFALRVMALILVAVYLQLLTETIRRKYGVGKAIAFLLGGVVVLRLLLLYFPDLVALRQFSLFDPSVYASDEFNKSLGDLLISAAFVCWFTLYTWQVLQPLQVNAKALSGRYRFAFGGGLIFVLILTTFHFSNVVFRLVRDSTISFNVAEFFSLSQYTVFGFIVLALVALTYYYFSQLLFRYILLAIPTLLHVYAGIAVVGLLFLTVRPGGATVLFYLPVLLWLVVYTLVLSNENSLVNRVRTNIAGVLFWIFVFSASLAALVLQGNRYREVAFQRSLAEKYYQTTNPNSEKLLRVAFLSVDPRFLQSNLPRFYKADESRRIRDSLIMLNFSGYSAQFATQMYLFDAANRPINNDEATTYAELNTIYTLQSKPTSSTEFIRYYETSFDQYSYITKRVIEDSTGVDGTMFIVSTPRQFQNSDAFNVELFRPNGTPDPDRSAAYDFALYTRGVLRNHSARYPFPISLSPSQLPANEVTAVSQNGYDQLWLRPDSQNLVLVVKKQNAVLESVTLFSYLFGAFLLMVGLLQGLGLLLRWSRNTKMASLFERLTIRNQIHGTVIFVSVFSFIIIGIATVTFFISRYQRNNEERLSRAAAITTAEMQKGNGNSSLFADGFSFSDSARLAAQRELVREIADIHAVDVNIYDISGNLQISSLNELYDRGILGRKIDPRAYYHLSNLREVQRVQNEELSTLTYLNIYTAVRDSTGRTYAYLNIPFFTSQAGLKQEISNLFVTIVNLNAFIFLLAGIVALFIANRITRSFSVIGDKMKEITLGKTAEEIVWNKKDEIGELVKQYNKMVNQLEQSAEALAKSEREGAWREMARQVAHEIKNPLTPMKLSIQYLQKAIQAGQPNVQQLTTNVATTLIEQIEHLSKIAADFSQFANIGNKKIETVDLHGIIGSLVDLYTSNPKIELRWKHLPQALLMRTDKTQMNRLFTNLLANAVDACDGRENCDIEIEETLDGRHITVAIRDNGEGIPAETRPKIFTPNFTTKTSGTGLGLAMSKNIAEQAGGAIWFETEEGIGTTFFVRLPLMETFRRV